MTWRQWRLLIADSFRVESRALLTTERAERRLMVRLRRIRRKRRRARAKRIRGYAVGWDHAQALHDDRVRTIRLEIDRRHRERLDSKATRYWQGGQVG